MVQAYIVYMGNRPEGEIISASALHLSMLREVLGRLTIIRLSKYMHAAIASY